MKKTSLILVLLLITVYTFAQTPDWIWAKSAGGYDLDFGYSITVDSQGNVYVIGCFISSTITFGSTTLTNTNSGYLDVFVAKMNADGNWLWAKSVGGNTDEYGRNIAVDSQGNTYVTGFFDSSSITFGSTTLTNAGGKDIFVAKMDADGNWLWAKSAGGDSYDRGESIEVDSQGYTYVTGSFYSSSITFGSTALTNNGYYDIFVAKMDADGNWLWAKSAGGTNDDTGYSMAVDSQGNTYVTGDFGSSSITFGSTTLTNNGYIDIYVAKMDADGNWLWAKSAGGTGDDSGYSMSVDSQGNTYVTGHFYSSSITFGSTTLTNNGYIDIFVTKMDADGNWLWAKSAGGTNDDTGYSMAVDNQGNTYLTGLFYSSFIIFGSTTLINTNSDYSDIFVAKMDTNGNWLWAESAGGTSDDTGYAISTDNAGNTYVTGDFAGIANFGSYELTSNGDFDIFVTKISEITSVENEIISTINVLSNYPNPFNPTTTIEFNIKENEEGVLSIYNIKGQLIESQQFNAGQYNYIWDASNQSSGIYLYELKTESINETKRMLLLK